MAALDRELGQLLRDALGEPPRVDEHDRRAVREDHRRAAADRSAATSRRRRRRRRCRGLSISVRRGHHRSAEIESPGFALASTISTGRSPPRYRATSISGRWVADRPMRCGSGRRRSSPGGSAARASAPRWMPRLVGASAWISSTMIVSTARSRSRERPASNRYSDSGVVIRICAGILALALALLGRRIAGAHVDRDLRAGAEPLQPGERRAQVALDVVRERLDRRHVDHARAAGRRSPARAPADRGTTGTPPASCRCRSARASACGCRAAMLAQPRAWTGGRGAKLCENHVRAASPNGASGSTREL